jgi:hypothetical protein
VRAGIVFDAGFAVFCAGFRRGERGCSSGDVRAGMFERGCASGDVRAEMCERGGGGK